MVAFVSGIFWLQFWIFINSLVETDRWACYVKLEDVLKVLQVAQTPLGLCSLQLFKNTHSGCFSCNNSKLSSWKEPNMSTLKSSLMNKVTLWQTRCILNSCFTTEASSWFARQKLNKLVSLKQHLTLSLLCNVNVFYNQLIKIQEWVWSQLKNLEPDHHRSITDFKWQVSKWNRWRKSFSICG